MSLLWMECMYDIEEWDHLFYKFKPKYLGSQENWLIMDSDPRAQTFDPDLRVMFRSYCGVFETFKRNDNGK